jgi:hypothetical protein
VTALGWIFMLLSLAFVWGLTFWCFYRVFTLPPEMPPDEAVPEPAQDFRSA